MNDEIVKGVIRRVCTVLALEADEVRPESRLIEDLGAESLDLVELMYEIEQEFDIRLTRDDMSLSAQLGLPEEEIHRGEVLTATALELLRKRFPEADKLLVEGVTRKHLAALLTVEAVAVSVRKKVAEKEEGNG
jgi:acyl carrier protein